MATTTAVPANLVFLRPAELAAGARAGSASPCREPRAMVVARHQLLERLDLVGELAPNAPLSFLIVQVRGLDTLRERGCGLTQGSVMSAVARRVRELTRATDHVGRFTATSMGVVLQGAGAAAASAVAARITFHLSHGLATIAPGLDVSVHAATGTGLNADILPVAALDSGYDEGDDPA